MKIAIGADHRGASAARQVAEKLAREGNQVEMIGDCGNQQCDYPEPAYRVGKAVAEGKAKLGVLICGTGIGVSIAANKVKGVRAAVAHDELTAQLSRSHNDANILCLSGDLLGQRLIRKDRGRLASHRVRGRAPRPARPQDHRHRAGQEPRDRPGIAVPTGRHEPRRPPTPARKWLFSAFGPLATCHLALY